MFIGRWQPFHKGHEWLVEQQLQKGKAILLAIRDVPPDDKQPFTAEQVKNIIETRYANDPRVRAIIIPDIESVNYGRGVGYEVIEHQPNSQVSAISATQIREMIRLGNDDWRGYIDSSVQHLVEDVVKSKTVV